MTTQEKVEALFDIWNSGGTTGYSIGQATGLSRALLGHYQHNPEKLENMALGKAETLAAHYDKIMAKSEGE